MYRINYRYYERDEKDRFCPKGFPIESFVDGDTIKAVNKAYENVKYNHDLFKHTMLIFDSIEEIK